MITNPLFLLIDDDPDDLMLLKDAIHSINNTIQFAEARDGRSALNYLKNLQKAALPCLMILDINMPVLNGRELLSIIKGETQLQNIAIVVFTTSSYPGDIEYCKQYDVELITKPFDMTELIAISKKLISTYCQN